MLEQLKQDKLVHIPVEEFDQELLAALAEGYDKVASGELENDSDDLLIQLYKPRVVAQKTDDAEANHANFNIIPDVDSERDRHGYFYHLVTHPCTPLVDNELQSHVLDVCTRLGLRTEDDKVFRSGNFWYPSAGYMSWHTNEVEPYIRLYLTYSDEENSSFFAYIKDGEVHKDYDRKGWTIRAFYTGAGEDRLWHYVQSSCNRFSLGYRIGDLPGGEG